MCLWSTLELPACLQTLSVGGGIGSKANAAFSFSLLKVCDPGVQQLIVKSDLENWTSTFGDSKRLEEQSLGGYRIAHAAAI